MIYVDGLQEHSGWGYHKRMKYYCHMWSASKRELHLFAERLELKSSWFQKHPYRYHYDLSKLKRKLAVQNGAMEITTKELVRMMMKESKKETW